MHCNLIWRRHWHDSVSMWPTYSWNFLPNKLNQWIVAILHIASNCRDEATCRSECRFNHWLLVIFSCSVDVSSPCRSTYTGLHLIVEITFLDSTWIYYRSLSSESRWVNCHTPWSIYSTCILSIERWNLLHFLFLLLISTPSIIGPFVLPLMVS